MAAFMHVSLALHLLSWQHGLGHGPTCVDVLLADHASGRPAVRQDRVHRARG